MESAEIIRKKRLTMLCYKQIPYINHKTISVMVVVVVAVLMVVLAMTVVWSCNDGVDGVGPIGGGFVSGGGSYVVGVDSGG